MSSANRTNKDNRPDRRLAGEVATVVAALPLAAAVVNDARDSIVINAEMARSLGFKSNKARRIVPLSRYCAWLARHTFTDDSAARIERRIGGLLAQIARNPRRRSFHAWIRGRKTTFETVGHDGLIWLFVKEQLDAATSKRDGDHLSAAVENMAQGLAMLDAHRRLVVCNSQFAAMYSIPERLTAPGTPFEEIEQERRARGLKSQRLPDGFEAGDIGMQGYDPKTDSFFVERENGRLIRVLEKPLADGGTVSTHVDITDRVEQEKEMAARQAALETQNMRLDATVDAIPHGLAMFDSDHKLVTCNRAFIEINRVDPELAVPGTSRDDMVASSVRNGFAPRKARDRYIEEREMAIESGVATYSELELSDGRQIVVGHHPTADGGWVSFHQDVTELRSKQALAERRSAELETQNERFMAAVNNMAHGLAMFDSERRLVVCNRPFADLYELPAHLTVPGAGFGDILAHRAQVGMIPKDTTLQGHGAAIEKLIEQDRASQDVCVMQNGRVIDVLHKPMPGGGWVATHRDITEEHRNAELIEHMARHDPLTDLPNRSSFTEELARAEARVKRGEKVALLCLDLDNFKEINDTLGHTVGDRLLQEVARRIDKARRDHETAARMGGDEFMLLLGPLDKPHHAGVVAQRLLGALDEPMQIEGHQITVGASIGISVAPEDGTDGDTLMRNADLALYRAKAGGRGTYHFFEQGMDVKMHERRQLEQGLKSALVNDEFSLVYQPLLDLSSNRISGFEALLRWSHPKLGQLAPSQFIPVAEETGIIVPLGRWVLRQACTAALDWPEHVHVAVNLSPAQFKDRDLAGSVRQVLETTGLAPDRLELEITESLLLHNAEGNLKTLHELRTLGVGISMDDFGTGYSALNYLRSFPFDKIKIDRSFIADIGAENDDALVRAVIGLGRSLGIATTAEGVETEEQLELVRGQGCAEVQGYLFSPPLPPDSAGELLEVTETRAARLAGLGRDKASNG